MDYHEYMRNSEKLRDTLAASSLLEDDSEYEVVGQLAVAQIDGDAGAIAGSSSDEEYDRRMYGIHAALPVEEGEPDWESGPATTAEEYLRRVRYEAAQCAQTVRADGRSHKKQRHFRGSSLPPDASVAACPEWARPSYKWVRCFVQDFRQLADQLSELELEQQRLQQQHPQQPLDADAAWERLRSGAAASSSGCGADAADAAALPQPLSAAAALPQPLLQTLLRMDHVATVELLERLVDQLPSDGPLDVGLGLLLFGLAARLQRPLPMEVAACFRALLRECCARRASLGEQPPRDAASKEPLPLLNVLIAIAGAHFGQDEELARLVAD